MRMNAINLFQPRASVKFGQESANKKSGPPNTQYLGLTYGGISGPAGQLPEEHLMGPAGIKVIADALKQNAAWEASQQPPKK